MLNIETYPSLRNPVMLCAVSGWSDGAFVASGALRFLMLKRQAERFAEFDADAIYSYSLTRPTSTIEAGRRVFQWPAFFWSFIRVPEAAHDLVILVGPEPDLRWRECVAASADLMQRIGVTQLITLGAFLAPVHYAAEPALIGISPDPEQHTRLQSMGLSDTNYEGPTGFVTAIANAATSRGILAASIWTAAPSYLANMSNPRLSSALLSVVERLIEQDLWREDLEVAGRDVQRRIDELLRSRPDLLKFLRSVGEEETDATPRETPQEDEGELPSADEVLKNLEDHLRRLRNQEQDDPGSGL